MTLDEYQQEALRCAPREEGAYPVPKTLLDLIKFQITLDKERDYVTKSQTEADLATLFKRCDQMVWSLGLAGEAGEFADMMKKVHGHGHTLDPVKASKELGDVLWYVSVLAHSIGVTLDQVAELNVAKLRARYPDGFTIENSLSRKDGG